MTAQLECPEAAGGYGLPKLQSVVTQTVDTGLNLTVVNSSQEHPVLSHHPTII